MEKEKVIKSSKVILTTILVCIFLFLCYSLYKKNKEQEEITPLQKEVKEFLAKWRECC